MFTTHDTRTVSRRSFLRTIGASGAGLGVAGIMSGGSYAACHGQRPNILFIMADDLGWGDVGFTRELTTPAGSNRMIRTPNLDRYATEQGMRFSQFYSASCTCSPTRIGCLTGKYPNRFGINYACCGDSNQGIPWGTHTVAQLLKHSGYTTCHIGKWHMGGESEADMEKRLGGDNSNFPGPNQLGFDDAYYNGVGECYYAHGGSGRDGSFYVSNSPDHGSMAECIRYNDTTPYELGGKTIDGAIRENINNIDSHFEIGMQKLEDYKDGPNPFFMQIWTYVPHEPVQLIEDHAAQYQDDFNCAQPVCDKENNLVNWEKQAFASMVSCLDYNIGRIFARLDELGLSENTLVFFTSDNGPFPNNAGSANPLKGGKFNFFEGGVRMPTFARWTGRIPAETINTNVGISMDLLPTFCELAGTPMDWVNTTDPFDRNHLDGRSLLQTMLGTATLPDRTLYFKRDKEDNRAIIRGGKDKFVMNDYFKSAEYFDIQADPAEKNPLGEIAGLRSELEAWVTANENANSGTMASKNPQHWGFAHGYEYEPPFDPGAVSRAAGHSPRIGRAGAASIQLAGGIGSGTSRVILNLPFADRVRVQVHNQLGRVVAQLGQGLMSAGTHRVSLGRIPRGSYVVSLEGERFSARRTIAVASR